LQEQDIHEETADQLVVGIDSSNFVKSRLLLLYGVTTFGVNSQDLA
jgi:hypothetical protein